MLLHISYSLTPLVRAQNEYEVFHNKLSPEGSSRDDIVTLQTLDKAHTVQGGGSSE